MWHKRALTPKKSYPNQIYPNQIQKINSFSNDEARFEENSENTELLVVVGYVGMTILLFVPMGIVLMILRHHKTPLECDITE
jgi:hypothetical protein